MSVDRGLRVRWARIPGQTAPGVLDTPLYLPVVMGPFEELEEFGHTEYDTIDGGQFSAPTGTGGSARRLRGLDLSSMTLDWDASWLTTQGVDREEMRREVLLVGRTRRPFEMLATLLGNREELRMAVTLRSVTRILKPGEPDTRYYELALREWIEAEGERRTHAQEIGRHGHRLPATAPLTADTTFVSLAREFYGTATATFWRAIAEANGLRSWGGGTPIAESKRFKVGDKVRIPVKPGNDDNVRTTTGLVST